MIQNWKVHETSLEILIKLKKSTNYWKMMLIAINQFLLHLYRHPKVNVPFFHRVRQKLFHYKTYWLLDSHDDNLSLHHNLFCVSAKLSGLWCWIADFTPINRTMAPAVGPCHQIRSHRLLNIYLSIYHSTLSLLKFCSA